MEVDGLVTNFEKDYNLPIMFHYVYTEQNPANLITRGLSYNKYLNNMKFWLEGSEWLTNNFENWPKYPLMSISPEHKNKINVNYTNSEILKVNTGILDINKSSSYEKLLRCTSYIFKWLCKLKDGDPKKRALEYWIKVAQRERFSNEINFLKTEVKSNKVMPLVLNFNLFLDEKGIFRSRGRIAKCLYFDYNVKNPVLLPKGHRVTSLYINYCHAKVQHLGTGTTLNYSREQGYWIPKGLVAEKIK